MGWPYLEKIREVVDPETRIWKGSRGYSLRLGRWVLAWCGVWECEAVVDLPCISSCQIEAGRELQSRRRIYFQHLSAW